MSTYVNAFSPAREIGSRSQQLTARIVPGCLMIVQLRSRYMMDRAVYKKELRIGPLKPIVRMLMKASSTLVVSSMFV